MKNTTEKTKSLKIACEYILLHVDHFAVFSPIQRIKFHKVIGEFIESYYDNITISEYILNYQGIKKLLPTIRGLCLSYEKKLEKQLVNQFLQGEHDNLNNYVQEKQELLQIEGSMAELKNTSKIIVLGSGYLPGTALLLSKFFKANITCIDNDLESIDYSKKLIKKLSLESEIHIKFGDATTFPIDSYDAIFITGSCIPKKAIFNHINNETKKAKIIYRNPIGLYKLWYTPATSKDIEKFKILKRIDNCKEYPFDSMLLTK